MFDGFTQTQIQTSDPQVAIHLRYGGNGPPLLLLHGNPLTHVHWHLVAPRLAKDFTVVVADLRGYGDSGKPRGLRAAGTTVTCDSTRRRTREGRGTTSWHARLSFDRNHMYASLVLQPCL